MADYLPLSNLRISPSISSSRLFSAASRSWSISNCSFSASRRSSSACISMNVLREDIGPGTGAGDGDVTVEGVLSTGFLSTAAGILGTGVVVGVGGGEGEGDTTFFLSPAANRSRNGLFALTGGVVSVGAGSVFDSSVCNDVLNRGNTRFNGIRSAEQTTITHKTRATKSLMFVTSTAPMTIFYGTASK